MSFFRGLSVLGRAAQTCDENPRSRCNSKFCIISSKDLPAGVLEDLKTQAHSEQPKPRKRSCSIHINFRVMAPLVAVPAGVRATKFTCANLDGLSGILHRWKILLVSRAHRSRFGLKLRNRFKAWLRFAAICIAQYQDRKQRSVDRSSSSSAFARLFISDPRLSRKVHGKQRPPSRTVWRTHEY